MTYSYDNIIAHRINKINRRSHKICKHNRCHVSYLSYVSCFHARFQEFDMIHMILMIDNSSRCYICGKSSPSVDNANPMITLPFLQSGFISKRRRKSATNGRLLSGRYPLSFAHAA